MKKEARDRGEQAQPPERDPIKEIEDSFYTGKRLKAFLQGAGIEPARKITVRWWDGYLEVFDSVKEWRAGAYLLWIRISNGHTRHIPLAQVRWFEPEPNEMREEKK